MKRTRLRKIRKPIGKTASDLALEFQIVQEQIKDSSGSTKKELIKQRDAIVKKYKRMVK